jgi:hypothetical protein
MSLLSIIENEPTILQEIEKQKIGDLLENRNTTNDAISSYKEESIINMKETEEILVSNVINEVTDREVKEELIELVIENSEKNLLHIDSNIISTFVNNNNEEELSNSDIHELAADILINNDNNNIIRSSSNHGFIEDPVANESDYIIDEMITDDDHFYNSETDDRKVDDVEYLTIEIENNGNILSIF